MPETQVPSGRDWQVSLPVVPPGGMWWAVGLSLLGSWALGSDEENVSSVIWAYTENQDV